MASAPVMEKVSLEDKLSRFDSFWDPKIVASLNGQEVKLVKLEGPFVWHHYEAEDELFLVLRGRLRNPGRRLPYTERARSKELEGGAAAWGIVS